MGININFECYDLIIHLTFPLPDTVNSEFAGFRQCKQQIAASMTPYRLTVNKRSITALFAAEIRHHGECGGPSEQGRIPVAYRIGNFQSRARQLTS